MDTSSWAWSRRTFNQTVNDQLEQDRIRIWEIQCSEDSCHYPAQPVGGRTVTGEMLKKGLVSLCCTAWKWTSRTKKVPKTIKWAKPKNISCFKYMNYTGVSQRRSHREKMNVQWHYRSFYNISDWDVWLCGTGHSVAVVGYLIFTRHHKWHVLCYHVTHIDQVRRRQTWS